MQYNLIIHDQSQNRTRLYGSYETHKDAARDARRIFGKIVGYTPIDCPLDGGRAMRVDFFRILDDIEYINTKF